MKAIQRQVSLKSFHTFGTEVRAEALAAFHSADELRQLLEVPEFRDKKKLFLGGGSNVLFLGDVSGLVLLNRIPGIAIEEEDSRVCVLRAGAGVVWQDMVSYAVTHGWGGIENLSLIPGCCGAAPMQNIGAYGVELKDVFEHLEALDLQTMEIRKMDRATCAFGYRDSIFKQSGAGRYVILSISLRLQKQPDLHLEYGAIKETLERQGIRQPGIRDVSEAVIAIRRSKLPDPAVLGNAGSFFKNPELSGEAFALLQQRYPDIPHYALENQQVKVPAGWLIEKLGWKGKRMGHAGCHEQQALVLVNHGGASGAEIWALASAIRDDIWDKAGVLLQPEVNLIGAEA